ncbi:MAG: OmpP1/FadL family transporter, partial [Bacteroidales bacterium]
MKKISLLMLVLCLFAAEAFSGGYQVRLQGHRQTAMGLVGTSLFGDASNLFYNPAGLSLMKTKHSFLVGGSGIFNNTIFSLENSIYQAETDNPMGTPLFAYGASMVTDKLGVGLGVYTPFGSSAKWGDDWAGAHLIQDISMRVFFIQPTVSYKFNEIFSVGAGFVFATGSVELNRAVPYNSADAMGQVNLQGNTTAFGFNAGVMVTPTEAWSIGVNYRSKVVMSMEGGDADFTIPTSVQTIIPSQNKFDADLPLPANLDLGVSYRFSEKFLLSAEVNYVFWDTYDSLNFTFEKEPELLNSNNPRLYENTLIFRLGGEYQINEMITVRAGVYYDPTPTNEDYFNPETPSLDTYGLS